jgi:hypothetical protein
MSELDMPAHAKTEAKPTLKLRVEISGTTATLYVDTNMHIAKDHVGMGRNEGEGHIHLYLDDGEKRTITDKKYVIPDLEPGNHKVKVSLHNNDHTPYDVSKQVDFNIK